MHGSEIESAGVTHQGARVLSFERRPWRAEPAPYD